MNKRVMSNYKYFPHTEQDIDEMLSACGMHSTEDLYADVPECIRFHGEYDLPHEMSEIEHRQWMDKIANENHPLTCFGGAGVYDHYMPSVIPSIIQRSEYLTSYTPYQAEISQGTLHYIFEYQSMMAELTGMDVSNASMYDGSTATAEAMMMAMAVGKKCDRVLISSTLDPKIIEVVKTYAHWHGVGIEMVKETDGVTDKTDLNTRLQKGGVAGVIVQQPNYHGIIEDFSGMSDMTHDAKALFIMNSVAADLALLHTPGEWGADVAVGDAQSLGIPMCFGGPYVGYMCCTEKLIRKMPGRIVGMTHDNRGQRAFVLTLQAREQHIRRQKATSNICSNQSLMALFVTVYMSIMGKQGLQDAAQLSYDGAHYLASQLENTGHFHLTYNCPFFNEFCITYDGDATSLLSKLEQHGIFGGIQTGEHEIMIAVTEQSTKQEIDQFVSLVK